MNVLAMKTKALSTERANTGALRPKSPPQNTPYHVAVINQELPSRSINAHILQINDLAISRSSTGETKGTTRAPHI